MDANTKGEMEKTEKSLAKKAKKLARALETARNAKLYWAVREPQQKANP